MASESNPSPQPSGERWGSRIGVILAVAGSAVGLGNFLRFPGQAAQNGGGAFMLPYFISLLVLGIPLCWAEWTMGRYGGLSGFNSAPGIYSSIWRNRAAKYFGAIALLLPLIIYMYYVLIEAWCLGYAINYLTGDLMLGDDPNEYSKFFGGFVGIEENGSLLASGRRTWLLVLVGVFAFNFTLIYRGVTKGIESFCKVAMPLMIVLALIVLVRVLTLGTPNPDHPDQSVLGGLNFMWNPNLEKLSDPQTWLAASGQIFFSLSVGFGIIINYSSYLTDKDDVVLSGLTSSSMNEFFEVCLGGLITLPAAFIFMGVAAGDQSTFGLGFNALPNVFAQMPGGQVIGFLWFFMLFIAAITSSVSMLQPVIAFFEEGFGLKRHASAALLGLVSALGTGFVVYFSKGLVALDTMDFWVGSVLIFILALIQAVLYGWVMGIERGEEEAHKGAHIRIPKFVQLMLKYVVPVYLIVIFVAFCYSNLPSSNQPVTYKETEESTETIEFVIPSAVMQSLEEGSVPEPLIGEFKKLKKDEGLDQSKLVQAGESWEITNKEGKMIYRIESTDDAWQVLEHKPGKVESILASTEAFSSVLFILIILGFLLLLIYIAGQRWEQEGRLTYDAPPTPVKETNQ